MVLLAFDTATPAVTAAVHDGRRVLAESRTIDPRRHGELLAPMLAEVLAAAGRVMADVSQIAVGVGPGPFTGLRVGVVTARTLGLVRGVPVRGVCTLDVLAAQVETRGPFGVASDARRREVYWARYDGSGARVAGPEVVSPALRATDDPVAGEGARLWPECFPHAVEPAYPSAAVLAEVLLAGRTPALPAVPLYLRRPDIAPPAVPKRVRPR